MTIIFRAKTTEAYKVKVLMELLGSNIKNGCFKINKSGVYLRMMDNNRRILIDLVLRAENFNIFDFTGTEMYIGINLSHLHKMIKTTKKKDSLELAIDDDDIHNLAIKVIPKENSHVSTSFVVIQDIQTLDVDLPEVTSKPIIVPSPEIQKVLKDMCNIGGTNIHVISKEHSIWFKCNTGGVFKKMVEFGEIIGTSDEDPDYNQTYSSDHLNRIIKIAGLSSQLKIFPGIPTMFKTNIGSIGDICVYLKSKEQLDAESRDTNDAESEE